MRGTPLTDLSGTITTGGTSQALVVANTARKYLRVSNPSTAPGSLFVNDKGAAASTTSGTSMEIQPGVIYSWEGSPPIGAVAITSATTSHAFEAAEG